MGKRGLCLASKRQSDGLDRGLTFTRAIIFCGLEIDAKKAATEGISLADIYYFCLKRRYRSSPVVANLPLSFMPQLASRCLTERRPMFQPV